MDERLSEFSSLERNLMGSTSEDPSNQDIQDFCNYPRDSFVDHTPNSYINKNISTPFQKTQYPHDSLPNENEVEYGYSSHVSSNIYKHVQKNNNKKHSKNEKKINKKSLHPENEPTPEDTIVEEEPKKEEIINENINDNTNDNINDNLNIENNTPQSLNNNNNKKIYDMEKLYEKCSKNGIPPPDGDFSLEGWKLFYPPEEKFFLWEKGKTIPNQILVENENDDENIEIYEGEINAKNERHGFGILTTPKYIRKGTWRDGEFTGWCRESRVNGDIFEGKFIDGAIYGKGINKNHRGNLYVGDFVDNKREGVGELKTKRIHYEGEFKYDKFNGKGKIEFVKEGHYYEGDFKDNEICGKGKFTWSNGDVYEGEMTNGKMNGQGKYTYSNGQIYEGSYKNGVKEGFGKLIYPNNKIYEGEFKNGKPEGEGTIITNGKIINIVYKDGKFHKK